MNKSRSRRRKVVAPLPRTSPRQPFRDFPGDRFANGLGKLIFHMSQARIDRHHHHHNDGERDELGTPDDSEDLYAICRACGCHT